MRFLGSLPQSQLPHWYRAADVFVLPSRSEGVPNVLLEASACGVPWVASRVGGIPEIAHLAMSRLVAPGEAAALADAMRESICQEGEAELPPARGREDAVDELESFLRSVEAGNGASDESLSFVEAAQ